MRSCCAPAPRCVKTTTDLPPTPGLYAVFAELDAQEQLGLPVSVGELPIYVGKYETSLLKRDGETHFKLGQTGQSILRRSIAALLHDALGLCGQPRNPSNPGYFDKFGLAPQHDEALQRWIGEHLTISTGSSRPTLANRPATSCSKSSARC